MTQVLILGLTFLYGIVIGSFLNVCIYRIPKKESIVTVGSHCMSCNHELKWYDLFPLFSFLFLRGKCRYCGVKLSPQYPIIEAVNGVLYVIVIACMGLSLQSVMSCLFVSALLTLSVIDFRTMEIPVSINAFILALGIISTIVDYKNWISHVAGFFAVSVFLLVCLFITRGRGIGGGDIKLMAVAGLFVGWANIVLGLVIGCVVGAIIQCIIIAVTKKKDRFAFGPYLSVGIFLAMLLGDLFWDWYLGLVQII